MASVRAAESPAAPPADALAPGTRVAVVGISVDDPCGVRDHAVLLGDALAARGATCSLHWLWREEGALGSERAQLRIWAGELARELAGERPDAILLHYSVFAFSHRGVPLLIRPLLTAIAELDVPLVAFMHEYAYPWRLGGARGKVWALTQRLALRELVRASDGLVVSAGVRAGWLDARPWLPRRPTAVAPVFSNLPSSDAQPHGDGARVGLFGYGHEGVDVATVLDSLRLLGAPAGRPELVLLGAPGSPSPAAARWKREAEQRGLAGALSFSGKLPAQELSDLLAGCDVLLFAERGGPTSRKTTLAASLASGRPVVALDGPSSWDELLAAHAASVVRPQAPAVAGAIKELLGDRDARLQQGERGRAFARRAMSAEHSAQVVAGALARAIDGARG